MSPSRGFQPGCSRRTRRGLFPFDTVPRRNAASGSCKVTVERPLRLKGIDREREYSVKEPRRCRETAEGVDGAPPAVGKIHKASTVPDPLRGPLEVVIGGKPPVMEHEPDTELRDSEEIPFS